MQKVIIDEVDIMLDLGFRFQLLNIFDLLPERRQHIMFSATMTTEVGVLIEEFFIAPQTITIAVSGTPLDNIEQQRFDVPNFHTKVNLVEGLITEKEVYKKVLIFVAYKRMADKLFELLDERFYGECCVIHGNKTQNYRLRSIEQFEEGTHRILIATDVMARGLDITNISHVINFETPEYPENYMHRIGRTGRAEQLGHAILFSTPKEQDFKEAIEALMQTKIPVSQIPHHIKISDELLEEERDKIKERHNPLKAAHVEERGEAFHEKKDKNKKTNQGGSYRREITKKYKKPKTRGDKNYNKRNKKKIV